MDELVRLTASDFDPPSRRSNRLDWHRPLIFSSPHSGATYPERFLAASRLDPLTLRRSEDAFVDELFLPCVSLGAPLLRAKFPRAYLDVNREPYELDPKVFEGNVPEYANTRSLRVAVGLGTIPRVVGDAQPIYRQPISVSEGLARIEALYRPYHERLRTLVDRAHGRVRPRAADRLSLDAEQCGRRGGVGYRARRSLRRERRAGRHRDPRDEPARRGISGFDETSRSREASSPSTSALPDRGIHAVQIEIARALYLDERSIVRNERWTMLRNDLFAAAKALAREFSGGLRPSRLAAE